MREYTYSRKIVKRNSEADTSLLGVRLGRLCIENAVPVSIVAKRLDIAKPTIYDWFCGKVGVSKHLQKAVIDFCREMTDPSGPPSKA